MGDECAVPSRCGYAHMVTAVAESDADAESDVDADADAESDVDADADAESDVDADADAPRTDAVTVADAPPADAESDVDADAVTVANTVTVAVADAPADTMTVADAPADTMTVADAPADTMTVADAPADAPTFAVTITDAHPAVIFSVHHGDECLTDSMSATNSIHAIVDENLKLSMEIDNLEQDFCALLCGYDNVVHSFTQHQQMNVQLQQMNVQLQQKNAQLQQMMSLLLQENADLKEMLSRGHYLPQHSTQSV